MNERMMWRIIHSIRFIVEQLFTLAKCFRKWTIRFYTCIQSSIYVAMYLESRQNITKAHKYQSYIHYFSDNCWCISSENRRHLGHHNTYDSLIFHFVSFFFFIFCIRWRNDLFLPFNYTLGGCCCVCFSAIVCVNEIRSVQSIYIIQNLFT